MVEQAKSPLRTPGAVTQAVLSLFSFESIEVLMGVPVPCSQLPLCVGVASMDGHGGSPSKPTNLSAANALQLN